MTRACIAIAAAALLIAAGCGDDGPAAPSDGAVAPTGPLPVTVERYDYAFDLDSRQAAVELTLHADGDGDCITLPLRVESLDPAVTFDGAPAASLDSSGGQMAACGRGWHQGDTIHLAAHATVALATLGPSQVGYSVSYDADDSPFYYLVSWVGGCDRFAPCDSAPDRFARYHFTVSHPAGVTVLCPGTITAGATLTECDFDRDGGPTYSTFGLVASPAWVATDLGAWPSAGNPVRVTLYDRPSTGIAEDLEVAQHQAFFAWMQEHFGDYPYGDELRLAVGPTYWSGFEHPGNIVLFDRLNGPTVGQITYADPLEHVVDHEIAHQWAGDQTTLADTYDFVWKEAMAEYLTFVFEDELDNGDAARTTFLWKALAGYAAHYPVPEDRPALIDYYGDAYGPGPMVLFRQLEVMYSRDAVMAAIASLLGHPHAIGIADVQAALEEQSGAELGAYFDTWVHGSGAPTWPTLRVAVAPSGPGQVEVSVTQETPASPSYGCAFTVALNGAEGERQEVRFDLGPDGSGAHSVSAEVPFAVTGWTFDPKAECLAQEAAAGAVARRPRPAGWTPWRGIPSAD